MEGGSEVAAVHAGCSCRIPPPHPTEPPPPIPTAFRARSQWGLPHDGGEGGLVQHVHVVAVGLGAVLGAPRHSRRIQRAR